jgi:hypothetical protein
MSSVTNHPNIAIREIQREIDAYQSNFEALSQQEASGELSVITYINKVMKLDNQAIMGIKLLVSGKKDMDLRPEIKKDSRSATRSPFCFGYQHQK